MRKTLAPLAAVSDEVSEERKPEKKKKRRPKRPTDGEENQNVHPIYGTEAMSPTPPEQPQTAERVHRRRKRSQKTDSNEQPTPETPVSPYEEPETPVEVVKKQRKPKYRDKSPQKQDNSYLNVESDNTKPEDTSPSKPFRPRHSVQKEEMVETYSAVVDELKSANSTAVEAFNDSIFDNPPEPVVEHIEEAPIQRVKTPILSSVYGSVYQKQREQQRIEDERRELELRQKERQDMEIEEKLQKEKKRKRLEKKKKDEQAEKEEVSKEEDEKMSEVSSIRTNNFFNDSTAVQQQDDEINIPTSPVLPIEKPPPTALASIRLFFKKSRNLIATGRFIEYNQQPAVTSQKHALFKQESYIERKENVLMTVRVHKSDQFPLDAITSHPFVKVSVLDTTTGLPLTCAPNIKEKNRSEYVLPVMTKPYNMRKKKTTAPMWNEVLYFEHNYYHFLKENIVFMFELLDFPEKRGMQRIAWGFLKSVSSSGRSNTEVRNRLQLYRYPSKGIKWGQPTSLDSNIVETGKELFSLYQYMESIKPYPSSLYVTLKAFEKPARTVVQFPDRPVQPNQIETGRYTVEQLLHSGVPLLQTEQTMETTLKKQEEEKKRLELEKRRKRVARKRNERSEIPTKLLCRIDSARGCVCTRFSNNGRYLACGCGPLVKVYDIWTNGHLEYILEGHVNIVYEVNWDEDDQRIVTASSDGTARIWYAKSLDKSSIVLQHPCFVYAAVFHPSDHRIIVTGAYDCKIRIWLLDEHEGTCGLIKEIGVEASGHEARVNSICFDDEGIRMYSADGSGIIKVWSSRLSGDSDDRRFAGESFSIIRTIEDDEISQSNLTCIRVDPRNPLDRLLVHSQDNMIRRLDVSTRVIRCRYSGVKCHKNAQKSNFSPDGRYVVSGGDNGRVYFWNTETGDLIDKEGKDYGFDGRPVYDVAWSTKEHVIALCTFEDQPVRVYCYEKKDMVEDVEPATPELSSYRASRPSTAANWTTIRNVMTPATAMVRPITPPPSSFHRSASRLPASPSQSSLLTPEDYSTYQTNNTPDDTDAFEEMVARFTESLKS